MGCASSAVLPFRSGARGGDDGGESKGIRGMMSNFNDSMTRSVMTEKVEDGAHSKPVQNFIDGAVHVKDDIIHHVQDAGDAAANKVSMVVQDIEDSIDSALGKVKKGADDMKEAVHFDSKKEALEEASEALSEKAQDMKDSVEANMDNIGEKTEQLINEVKEEIQIEDIEKKAEDAFGGEIDELLATLPDEGTADKVEKNS